MNRIRDEGEPISDGRRDRRGADPGALRDALFAAAFFGGVVLINGILAILFIALAQAMGWWEAAEPGWIEDAALELGNRWQQRLATGG